ncbi:hypothetical protein PHMEG_00021672 [Phytophthora megakarya]|uniref:Uncharacterized protein n=1 Tax=Phytophthora megakarya TaxID=4795 RepID=A0A225VM75_9STRA|nr:hypothetical protein PHMEG_00021672 [Phytophthora megakarya]
MTRYVFSATNEPPRTFKNKETKRPQACQHQARATAVKTLELLLAAENTNMKHVRALINADPDRAGYILVTLMAKFGVSFAFHAGTRGLPLSRHSAAQYFRQVKCWLVDKYPSVERQLLSLGHPLDQHYIKRERGGFVKKAAACTKASHKKMTSYPYSTLTVARTTKMPRYCAASHLSFVRKQQLSIGAGEVFFISFIRVKTSDEQALSFFPDGDPAICPLLALALVLITQKSPCAALLNHLPMTSKDVPGELTESIPLLDFNDDSSTLGSSKAPSTNCSTCAKLVAGIHAIVNRLLDRVASLAVV